MHSNKFAKLSDFECRRARKSDYESVMAISEGIFGGVDIIPAVYFEYLDDPNRVFYVAVDKRNGKVVGFSGSRIIDNGETAEGEGARIDVNYRGNALIESINQAALQELMSKNNRVKSVRMVSVNVEQMSRNPNFALIPSTKRNIKGILRGIPEKEFLHHISQIKTGTSGDYVPLDNVKRAYETDIENIFRNYSTSKKLFPCGMLLRDSQSFSVGEKFLSNIPLIFGDRLQSVFMTRDDRNPKMVTALSFGTGIEAGIDLKMIRFCIDYYGVPDMDIIKGHVFKHLLEIQPCLFRSATAENVTCALFIPASVAEQFDDEAFLKFIKFDLGFETTKDQYLEQCVFMYTPVDGKTKSAESKL